MEGGGLVAENVQNYDHFRQSVIKALATFLCSFSDLPPYV